MKKSMLIPVFILVCQLGLSAQSGDFRFGLQLSPTISWMSTNDKNINGNGSNLGLKTGVMAEIFFAENYSLFTGMTLALNQGGTLLHNPGENVYIDVWTNSDDISDEARGVPNMSDFSYHIQYVEIPIALRLRTREFGYLRYFAEVPRFTLGFNTRGRGDIEGAVNVEDEIITKDVNPFSFSWGLGGGIEYSVSESTALVGGLFFQSSIIDVTRDKGAAYYDSPERTAKLEDEDSNGVINALVLRLGVMF